MFSKPKPKDPIFSVRQWAKEQTRRRREGEGADNTTKPIPKIVEEEEIEGMAKSEPSNPLAKSNEERVMEEDSDSFERALVFKRSKGKGRRKEIPNSMAKGRKRKRTESNDQTEEDEGEETPNQGNAILLEDDEIFWNKKFALKFAKCFHKRGIATGRIVNLKKLE